MNRKVEGCEGDTRARYRMRMNTSAISITSMHFNIPDPSHTERSHFGVANLDWGKVLEIICDDYLLANFEIIIIFVALCY
jgi:hypothetical protein